MARKAAEGNGQGRADIELDISDFGPIASGRIALRPLTVLVGPNNSGKSYASLLAHSVILACADLARAARSGDWAGALMESGGLRGMSGRAARLVASGSGGGEVAVPRGLSDAIHRCTAGRLFEESLASRMGDNFGSPLGALVRAGSRSSRIRIRGPIGADVAISRRGGATVRAGGGGKSYFVNGRSVTAAGAARNARNGRGAGSGRSGARPTIAGPSRRRGPGALHWLAAGIAEQAVTGVACGASRYIPAARSGMMRAREAPLRGTPGGPGPAGSGTAAGMPGLAGPPSRAGAARRNGGSGGAGRIIPDVFGGRLGPAGRGAGMLSYARGGASVPMHMSSSGVAGTAPLALAVSAMRPGDTLVAEEPEAHLHPQSQVRLARKLVGLVRHGMRVILSTHSVLLLEQMSIHVQLGGIAPPRRAAMGYGREEYLAPSEVAPYAFGGSAGKGHTISEIAHTADVGIPQDALMGAVESMSNDENRLHYARGGE